MRNGLDAEPEHWPVGTPVRSHYRARWTGHIVGHIERPNHRTSGARTSHKLILRIQIERDRTGRPLRKPRTVTLDWRWVERLEGPLHGPLSLPEALREDRKAGLAAASFP